MPRSPRRLDAVLAGLASSMRTFAVPAARAARGRIGGSARVAVLLIAAGELVLDKTPVAHDRVAPPPLAGRVAAGAYGGGAVGAVSAFVGAFGSWRARALVVDATGLPDPVVAVGEDVIAYALATLATR